MQLRHNEGYHSILLVDFLLLDEPKQKRTMTRILSLLDQRHLVGQVVHNRLDLVEVVLDKVLAGRLDLELDLEMVDQILVVAVVEVLVGSYLVVHQMLVLLAQQCIVALLVLVLPAQQQIVVLLVLVLLAQQQIVAFLVLALLEQL